MPEMSDEQIKKILGKIHPHLETIFDEASKGCFEDAERIASALRLLAECWQALKEIREEEPLKRFKVIDCTGKHKPDKIINCPQCEKLIAIARKVTEEK